MGIEVPQEESVIPGGEEIIEGGGEIWWAGGDGWNVDVENGKWGVVDGGSDCKVLCGCVVGKEGVGVDGGEVNGIMDEDDETAPARGARAITADGEEVIKWFELGPRS